MIHLDRSRVRPLVLDMAPSAIARRRMERGRWLRENKGIGGRGM